MLIAGVTGWAATLLLYALHARARRRLVLVARASHELRGPLCAARLGLDTLAAEPARVAAIDLELRRAARALDDLAAAPSGARAPVRRELVDLRALVTAHAPAWQALAAAHAAELRLDLVTEAQPGTLLQLPAPGAARRRPTRPAPHGHRWPPKPALPAATAGPVAGTDVAAELAPATTAGPVAGTDGAAAPAPATTPGLVAGTGGAAAPARLLREPPPAATPATAVYADPVRVAQACANLVANAVEHGGGVVRVRVWAAGDAVRVEVRDAGPGLPAPVSALVAAARARRGRRGHGLAIAAAVAGEHGGRLTAAPAATGARLVLELPAAAAAVLSRPRAVAPPEIVA